MVSLFIEGTLDKGGLVLSKKSKLLSKEFLNQSFKVI